MIIEFNQVSKTFKTGFMLNKKIVLDEFSFSVGKNELCGFLGLNGAGKSTTLKILMNFLHKDQGIVTLNLPGSTFVEKLNYIGYLPEQPLFPKSFTGLEIAKYLTSFYQKFSFNRLEFIKYAKQLKIDHALNNKLSTYSKGMLQRLSFIISFIHKPQLLILDEPFSGLDPIGRLEFKNILKDLNKQEMTILFTSHIVSELEEISSSLIVLKDGKNAYSGKISTLLDQHNKNEKVIMVKKDTNINFLLNIIPGCSIINNSIFVNSKDLNIAIELLISKKIVIEKISDNQHSLEEVVYDV